MALTAYLASQLVSHGHIYPDHALLVEAGRVRAVVARADVPQGSIRVDLPGLTLAPALVDLQVNGGGGVLFNALSTPEGIKTMVAAHQAAGTAALLPTLISDGLASLAPAFAAIRTVRQHGGESGVLGIHLEGPFLNPQQRGCHPAQGLSTAIDALIAMDFSGLGQVLITLAPELGAPHQLAALVAKGAILACGHSIADAACLAMAKRAGLRGITHLFNAMGGLHARNPGLSGLALDDDGLVCSVIADGKHVAPAMLRLAYKAKPPGSLFLVSDAMPPAGQTSPQGFAFFGQPIAVTDGACTDGAGHLFGSAATLFGCVRYAVQQAGIPLAAALSMASHIPAQFLGVADRGNFYPGSRADLIAFDHTLNLTSINNAAAA